MADKTFLPYGRQQVDEEDIAAVVQVLRSEWLTTGPMVEQFEEAVANFVEAPFAVAVSSGTAALHAAMFALNIGPGDEVILPSMTFAATANAVVYQGGTPVFADVDPATLLLDTANLEDLLTPRTRAIIAVDYAGQPCNYSDLQRLKERHGLALVADASHSLGAEYRGKKCGVWADLTTFSFHPVKPLTTAEGGMVVTSCGEYAERIRRFRNHGINLDYQQRSEQGGWYYEMTELGYNYRISDLQSALGLSQLKKLPGWLKKRRQIADIYRKELAGQTVVRPLTQLPNVAHGYHLFVVRVPVSQRARLFAALRAEACRFFQGCRKRMSKGLSPA